tara:strand:- start:53 stop:325 length:273 start_codon:yes stop_codon:yes gene_type:complete
MHRERSVPREGVMMKNKWIIKTGDMFLDGEHVGLVVENHPGGCASFIPEDERTREQCNNCDGWIEILWDGETEDYNCAHCAEEDFEIERA